MMNEKIVSFSPPNITDAEINEAVAVLRSGWITTGKKAKKFEEEIAAYCGTSKAVCLASATAAMEMTLRILGVGPGDEVITTAYTYTASASVIQHVGAKIVLVDTKPDSFEMDYDQIEQVICEKTKVIIPVDLGGRLCDYKKIYQILENKKSLYIPKTDMQKKFDRVIVMADCAHGFGAQQIVNGNYVRAGQFADFTCFSFHAVKNLTTGEGGAVVWKNRKEIDNEKLYQEYMLMSLHGQSKDAFHKGQPGAWEYDIVYPAYKCNMTDISAAIGISQLRRYDDMLSRRHWIISEYDKMACKYGCKTLVHKDEKNITSGHLYLCRIPGIDETERNEFIVKMAERGIACNVHYKPLPMMSAYKNLGFDIKDYPNAFRQYENEITLPLHIGLADDDVEYVVRNISELLEM